MRGIIDHHTLRGQFQQLLHLEATGAASSTCACGLRKPFETVFSGLHCRNNLSFRDTIAGTDLCAICQSSYVQFFTLAQERKQQFRAVLWQTFPSTKYLE